MLRCAGDGDTKAAIVPVFGVRLARAGLFMSRVVGNHAVCDEAYSGLENGGRIRLDVGQCDRGQVRVSGMWSVWSMLERARGDVLHRMFPAHLPRDGVEPAKRHGAWGREKSTGI